jgi:hypothetical protein
MPKPVKAEEIQGISLGKSSRNLRTIKMGQPLCQECQFPIRRNWWADCPHNPYFYEGFEEIIEPKFKEDENGDMIFEGEVKKLRPIKRLNLTQVPLSIRHYSGRFVEICQREKGFVLPSELGYTDLCQYNDCWLQVKVKTAYGDFCSVDQARLIAADDGTVALEVFDRTQRNAQLRKINVTE